jgi:glutamate transport system substrate-binding protein
MRRTLRHVRAAAATVLLLSGLGACAPAESEETGPAYPLAEGAAASFEPGSRMHELATAGTITIGVKLDQPGVGYQGPDDEAPTGFDPEVGKILAASLGIAPEDITWVEAISSQREQLLQEGKVDLVIASYSITPERRAVVGQAGPHYVTGQQLLVKESSDIDTLEDVAGEKVCSVNGSTSLQNIMDEGAEGVGVDTYSECVEKVLDGEVEAMTTDGAILLGYAAQHPGDLKVVVDPFSTERYGVGYSLAHPEMCQWIVDTITDAQQDSTWAQAFDATLGMSGVESPLVPAADACPTS